mmetsp:Transcript_42802/g.100349  ORF Transcript_42802/g.100349 Transcript_42802/m.100349 type:complete len:258 (-) Transcript_42802:51-824(-)
MANATIDWCESNYAVSSWVAEFWNTVSSAAMLAPALWGLRIAIARRYEAVVVVQFMVLIVVAVGTALFHASLGYAGQMVDELSMLAGGLNWVVGLLLATHRSRGEPAPGSKIVALVFVTIGFCGPHVAFGFTVVFQVFFTLFVLAGLVLLHELYWNIFTLDAQRCLVRLYLASLVGSVIPWQADIHACKWLASLPLGNPQLHAWWHVIVGYNCFVGGMLMQTALDAANAKLYRRKPPHPQPDFRMWLLPVAAAPLPS